MKQKSFAMSYYLVVGAIMLLTSCKKGDTGPAGAPGPAGPPGTTGPVGAANVIYSGWFNLDYNPETENGDTVRFVATITAPKLVDSILFLKGTFCYALLLFYYNKAGLIGRLCFFIETQNIILKK